MHKNRLSDRVLRMSESATLKMAKLGRELTAQGKDVISLSLGEPDFDTPDHIKAAAKKALDDGHTKYTPVNGLPVLRQAIVKKFKRDNNLSFDPDQIVVSNGAKQSLANLCLALLNKGDEVIVFTPYWVSYYEIIKLAEASPVLVAAGIEDDYKVRPSALKAAITNNTKMLMFSSPCNPSGAVYTQQELEGIAKVLEEHPDIIIVSDEIYEYINFSGKHASIGAIPEMTDRTVTVNGFSKGFAMTGWRLGYIGAPSWIAKACAKIQGQFTSGATAFGQVAAAHALNSPLGPTLEMKEHYIKRKKLVLDRLEQIDGIRVDNPQGAFYVFPDISYYFGKSNGKEIIDNANDFAENILTKALVGVVTGAAFGSPNCIRISYASSEENLTEALNRIEEYLKDFS